MAQTIEDFISDRVAAEYRPLVMKFRELIRKDFPELTEEMRGGSVKYYGVPVYRLNRIMVTISPTKKGVTYAFSEGGQFKDKYHMLEGEGDKTLNIRLSDPGEFDEVKMAYYVRQAVEIDSARGR